MDPTRLIGPSSPLGFPAPYWFMAALKVLGFTLHLIPMGLWFAGILVAMIVCRRGEQPRRFAHRLMTQMPVIVALGVNFGIVPLLFIQVAYYRVFYPATILLAWPWFAVIVLLLVAYYGVYLYALGLREAMTPARSVAGWVAAVLFVVIGFIFSNVFSLMTNLPAWAGLWMRGSVAGATTGLSLNAGDATLWPRWLLTLGLALMTTAAYAVVDAGFFARREPEAYRRWVRRFAGGLYALGAVWYAGASAWYVFGTWSTELRALMSSGGMAVLTVLTAVAPLLTLVVMLAQRNEVTGALAATVGLLQVVVLALNAISRQVVQNAELRRFLDVTAERLQIQWSPLVLFLLLFVAGLGVVAWMIARALEASRQPAPARR